MPRGEGRKPISYHLSVSVMNRLYSRIATMPTAHTPMMMRHGPLDDIDDHTKSSPAEFVSQPSHGLFCHRGYQYHSPDSGSAP